MSHLETPHRVAPPRAPSPKLQILALSGGGYRGLFTAKVLANLEEKAGCPLNQVFDVIAGTSIGGILACGIAQGIEAEAMAKGIQDEGLNIFPKSVFTSGKRIFTGAYDPKPLRNAIVSILGEDNANLPFNEIAAALLITTVSQTSARPVIFKSKGLAESDADITQTIDIAMSTSAAPTYFPAHRIEKTNLIDGGLVANAPDLVALTETLRHKTRSLNDIHLLSIGTASVKIDDQANPIKHSGVLGWLTRRGLVDLTLTVSERLALQQTETLLGDKLLRIDATPSAKQSKVLALDRADQKATDTLIQLATEATASAWASYGHRLTALLSHSVIP
ncbi:CBASS cGAMP-activated phospholipase [endosymbiont of Riftia pachyptila]|uniref:Patatin-like phospholipase A2 n=1 Tax=endosymbiont of Riftia pachyptila (vent Ph05) TaxID=1048808 RepID=G2DBS4_9GAMM|nr:CBASS cGAMP-activated phospholipase [endosymbiont of Riftia pachyptila]EGV51937.1 patatin-like phospholipase A2 [endosymbiont of Riftia pachyptila (vent Ph05)]